MAQPITVDMGVVAKLDPFSAGSVLASETYVRGYFAPDPGEGDQPVGDGPTQDPSPGDDIVVRTQETQPITPPVVQPPIPPVEEEVPLADESFEDLLDKMAEQDKSQRERQDNTDEQDINDISMPDSEDPGMEGLVDKAVETAAKRMGRSSKEILDKLKAQMPVNTGKSLETLIPRLKGRTSASSWKRRLRQVVEEATGIQDLFNPGLASRRIEGQMGDDEEVESIDSILIMVDTSASMHINDFKAVFAELQTMFTMPLARQVFEDATVLAMSWSGSKQFKFTKPFKGAGSSLFRTVRRLPEFGNGTDFCSNFLRAIKKMSAPDLYICMTDGDFRGRGQDILQLASRKFAKVRSKTIWVFPKWPDFKAPRNKKEAEQSSRRLNHIDPRWRKRAIVFGKK